MPDSRLFQSALGVPRQNLPPVFQKRYDVRAFSQDQVKIKGHLTIRRNWVAKALSALLAVLGALVPFEGENIPVTISFYSGTKSDALHFDRLFHRRGKKPFRFHSTFVTAGGQDIVELMRVGIGWRARFQLIDQTVTLEHVGYVWKIGKYLIPLPVTFLMGHGLRLKKLYPTIASRCG